MSTHIVGDVEATCEDIAVLNEGRILFRGTINELLQMVDGKVYVAEISTMEVPKMQERFLVTAILTAGSLTRIKIIADAPPIDGAELCSPDVEDAYMYLMHHKSGEV